MKNLLLLSVTAALISACGSTTPTPVTLASLTLGGVGNNLQISAPAKLNVTATGTDGNPFTGMQTFTSSDPSIVAVNADGTLNVRHLSLKPVALTVTEGDKTATLNVTTYGLDAVGGTYAEDKSTKAPGTVLAVQFRGAQGNAVADNTTVTVTGPAGFNGGAPYITTISKSFATTAQGRTVEPDIAAVTGTYTMTLTNTGTTYSKTFSIDATQTQPFATDMQVAFTSKSYSATGTLPANSPSVFSLVYPTGNPTVAYTANLTALPASGNLINAADGTSNATVAPGTYNTGTYAQSFLLNTGMVLPEQINRSFTYTGTVVIP